MVGESEVPLTEDLTPQRPREYWPTVSEWVSDGKAEQIIINNSASGGTYSMYEVPANFTLFITSASLTQSSTGGAEVKMFIGEDSGLRNFLACRLAQAGENAVSNSFPMPLRVNSGENVRIRASGAGNTAFGTFQGFLLPKKISIR